MSDHKFYVLGPDIKARGLNDGNVIDGINVIDYDGFVDLTTEHENCSVLALIILNHYR